MPTVAEVLCWLSKLDPNLPFERATDSAPFRDLLKEQNVDCKDTRLLNQAKLLESFDLDETIKNNLVTWNDKPETFWKSLDDERKHVSQSVEWTDLVEVLRFALLDSTKSELDSLLHAFFAALLAEVAIRLQCFEATASAVRELKEFFFPNEHWGEKDARRNRCRKLLRTGLDIRRSCQSLQRLAESPVPSEHDLAKGIPSTDYGPVFFRQRNLLTSRYRKNAMFEETMETLFIKGITRESENQGCSKSAVVVLEELLTKMESHRTLVPALGTNVETQRESRGRKRGSTEDGSDRGAKRIRPQPSTNPSMGGALTPPSDSPSLVSSTQAQTTVPTAQDGRETPYRRRPRQQSPDRELPCVDENNPAGLRALVAAAGMILPTTNAPREGISQDSNGFTLAAPGRSPLEFSVPVDHVAYLSPNLLSSTALNHPQLIQPAPDPQTVPIDGLRDSWNSSRVNEFADAVWDSSIVNEFADAVWNSYNVDQPAQSMPPLGPSMSNLTPTSTSPVPFVESQLQSAHLGIHHDQQPQHSIFRISS